MDNGHDMGALPDEVLFRRFADGDRSALEILAQRHERALLGLARGLLNGRDDAACDAVQETWLRIIRYAKSFRGNSTFKTWIYRIVINQCHTIRAAQNRSQGRSALHADTVPPSPTSASAEPESHATTTTEEDLHRLRTEVAKLTDDRRLVLLLCYHDGMTHQQAAEVLEIPVGTLKSRLHAALTQLRQHLPSEART